MITSGLGLALGGGAVLGAAHLGVLQAMESRGLRPEFVAGTSAGALVGACYAAGLGLDAIERLMLETRWDDVGRLTFDARLGILDSRALQHTAARIGLDRRIEDLPVRFAAVATDLLTLQEVAVTSGPLVNALRASIAIPGLFPPVVNRGRILIDGGLVANLPLAAVRDLGAEWVIAVRVRPEWEYLPIAPTADRIAQLEAESNTIVIRPDVVGLSMWRMVDVPRLIEAGRSAAETALGGLHDFETLGQETIAARLPQHAR
ncbi:MAG: patatin-like phospholipase family protein [Propionibacteriaceae bacterium]|nr:patatin-like phospholipase family protein [Propionibacteriaceae bacterium]